MEEYEDDRKPAAIEYKQVSETPDSDQACNQASKTSRGQDTDISDQRDFLLKDLNASAARGECTRAKIDLDVTHQEDASHEIIEDSSHHVTMLPRDELSDEATSEVVRSQKLQVTEDGRTLSAYEVMRLQRIQRNKQKLAQLGLQGDYKLSRRPQGKADKRKPPPTLAAPSSTKRARISRRTKAKVRSYAEPSVSVASLVRAQNREVEGGAHAPEKAATAEPKPKKEGHDRMDKAIHLEFKRIRGYKSLMLRQADRNARAADRELKFWRGQAERRKHRAHRREEALDGARRDEEERKQLGGTSKDLLQEIDKRWDELLGVVNKFDDKFEAEEKRQQREDKRVHGENKMKLLEALNRFPKAVKCSTSILNSLLLERAPKDPPPLRRSRRSGIGRKEGPEEIADISTRSQARPVILSSTNLDDLKIEDTPCEVISDSEKKRAGAKRRRNARNVGGWVSPNLAAVLQRSWLEKTSSEDTFDLTSYVPQIGDVVLYYPFGHLLFLDKFPDYLGQKTRSIMRMPLWDRAAADRAKEASGGPQLLNAQTNVQSESIWWSDEWIDGIKGELGTYPLVCRVKGAHAEFPPDPYVKTIRNGKVFWSKPKKAPPADLASHLRLAVILQPLTSVLPPPPKQNGEADVLAFPPAFAAVIFPSDLQPFIIPFAWGYTAAHSFSKGSAAKTIGSSNVVGFVKDYQTMAGRDYLWSLDGRAEMVASIQKRFGTDGSFLESYMGTQSQSFPLADTYAVVQTICSHVIETKIFDNNEDEVDLFWFMRSTLPLWDGVSISKDRNRGETRLVAPWMVFTPSVFPPRIACGQIAPDNLARTSDMFDELLRSKLEVYLSELVEEDQRADLFIRPITEDDAPSYLCAVPTGMSFEKILKRLGIDGKSGNYYRSIDSLQSDVSSIFENCLLYNSPEAEVVDLASEIVSRAKSGILSLTQSHFRELTEAKKADERRKRLAIANGGDAECTDSAFPKPLTFEVPFRGEIERNWFVVSKDIDGFANEWVPQAGENVEYCPAYHATFVQSHFSSLNDEHCKLPLRAFYHGLESSPKQSNDDARAEVWFGGVVMWTRPVFPKFPSEKSAEYEATFATAALLLAMGIVFAPDVDKELKTRIVYWRPCILAEEQSTRRRCSACSLPTEVSFVRPRAGEEAGIKLLSDLSKPDTTDIHRCLSLLKSRCCAKIRPLFIDRQLTSASVREGYLPPEPRVGHVLPSIESLYDKVSADSLLPPHSQSREKTGRTRRPVNITDHVIESATQRQKVLDQETKLERLQKSGFLASCMMFDDGEVDLRTLRRQESIVPYPKMCLDLVLTKLKLGKYRHREAVENDVIESYTTTVLLALHDDATRRKDPVSVKKICRSISKIRIDLSNPLKDKSSDEHFTDLSASEMSCVEHLKLVRELHVAALVATSDTDSMTRLFGLSRSMPRVIQMDSGDDVRATPSQSAARQRLEILINAVGTDELLNTFEKSHISLSPVPLRKLKIVCDNTVVTNEKSVCLVDRVYAPNNGEMIKVKIICRGKVVVNERDIPPLTRAIAQAEDKNIDVCITCDGNVVTRHLENPVISDQFTRIARLHQGKVRHKYESEIVFGYNDYDVDERLVRFFFGRPKRNKPCARCHVYRRSLLVCRVRRAHSNIDFDWSRCFDGVGGLDGMISSLQSDETLENETGRTETTANASLEGEVASSMVGEHLNIRTNESNLESNAADSEDGDESPCNHTKKAIAQEGRIRSGKASGFDPRELMGKAETAVELSAEIFKQAEAYSSAPVRLSKQFIQEAFPIDSSDGHYVFCVVCGMSGDLLCCDGCANVVHSKCIGLISLPEGDWFCDECTSEQAVKMKHAGNLDKKSGKPDYPRQPFGRNEFSQEAFVEVEALLGEINSSRPQPKYVKQKDERETVRPGREVENAIASSKQQPVNRKAKVIYKDDLSDNDENDSSESGSRASEADYISGNRKASRRRKEIRRKRSDDPLGALSDMNREFLKTFGIVTAEDLLASRTSAVARAFGKWRKKIGLSELKGTGEVASISTWKATVRRASMELGLNEIAAVEPFQDSIRRHNGRGRKRSGHVAVHVQSSEANFLPEDVDKGRSQRQAKRKRRESLHSSNRSPGSDLRQRDRHSAKKVVRENPLENLSEAAQSFLAAVRIPSATAFLDMRTTDIAVQLGKWRKKERLSKLRGSGEVATISAWKTTIRKAVSEISAAARSEVSDTVVAEPGKVSARPEAPEKASPSRSVDDGSSNIKIKSRRPSKRGRYNRTAAESEVLSVDSANSVSRKRKARASARHIEHECGVSTRSSNVVTRDRGFSENKNEDTNESATSVQSPTTRRLRQPPVRWSDEGRRSGASAVPLPTTTKGGPVVRSLAGVLLSEGLTLTGKSASTRARRSK